MQYVILHTYFSRIKNVRYLFYSILFFAVYDIQTAAQQNVHTYNNKLKRFNALVGTHDFDHYLSFITNEHCFTNFMTFAYWHNLKNLLCTNELTMDQFADDTSNIRPEYLKVTLIEFSFGYCIKLTLHSILKYIY